VVLITKFHELKRLMSAQPIANQGSWFAIDMISGLWVKHMLHPVEADFGISISCFRTGKVPPRSGVCSPCALVGGRRPGDEQRQGVTTI
jgi:hypothetical protein